MKWICNKCGSRNAFWRNVCLGCKERQAGWRNRPGPSVQRFRVIAGDAPFWGEVGLALDPARVPSASNEYDLYLSFVGGDEALGVGFMRNEVEPAD